MFCFCERIRSHVIALLSFFGKAHLGWLISEGHCNAGSTLTPYKTKVVGEDVSLSTHLSEVACDRCLVY